MKKVHVPNEVATFEDEYYIEVDHELMRANSASASAAGADNAPGVDGCMSPVSAATVGSPEQPGKGSPSGSRMLIGHSRTVSTTFLPQVAVASYQSDLCFTDLPGFLDTRNVEISIINAANIRGVLTRSSSVRVLLLIAFPALRADRLASVKTVMDTVCKLFGSLQAVVANQSSILIGITRADGVRLNGVKRMLLEVADFPPRLSESVVIIDPLEMHTEAPTLEVLRKRVDELGAIHQVQMFTTPLGDTDERLLETIARHIKDLVTAC
jgi:hypothetical protein